MSSQVFSWLKACGVSSVPGKWESCQVEGSLYKPESVCLGEKEVSCPWILIHVFQPQWAALAESALASWEK